MYAITSYGTVCVTSKTGIFNQPQNSIRGMAMTGYSRSLVSISAQRELEVVKENGRISKNAVV